MTWSVPALLAPAPKHPRGAATSHSLRNTQHHVVISSQRPPRMQPPLLQLGGGELHGPFQENCLKFAASRGVPVPIPVPGLRAWLIPLLPGGGAPDGGARAPGNAEVRAGAARGRGSTQHEQLWGARLSLLQWRTGTRAQPGTGTSVVALPPPNARARRRPAFVLLWCLPAGRRGARHRARRGRGRCAAAEGAGRRWRRWRLLLPTAVGGGAARATKGERLRPVPHHR